MGCTSQKEKSNDQDNELLDNFKIKMPTEEKSNPNPEEKKSEPPPAELSELNPPKIEGKNEESAETNMNLLITVWDLIKTLLVLMRAALGRNQISKIMFHTTEEIVQTLSKLKQKKDTSQKESLNNLLTLSTQIKEFCEKSKKAKSNSKTKNKIASKYKTDPKELKEIAKYNDLLSKYLMQLKIPLEMDIKDENKRTRIKKQAEELETKMDDTLKNLEENNIKVVGLAQNDLTNEEAFEFWVKYFPERYIVHVKDFSSKLRAWLLETKEIDLSDNNLDVIIRLMNREQIPCEDLTISAKEFNTFLEHLPVDVDWENLEEIEKEVAEDQEKRIAAVDLKRKDDKDEFLKKIMSMRNEESQEEKDLSTQEEFIKFLSKGSWFTTEQTKTEIFVRNIFINPKNGDLKCYGKDHQGDFKMQGHINMKRQFNIEKSYEGNDQKEVIEGILEENDMDGTLALLGNTSKGALMICLDVDHWFGYYLQGRAVDMQVCFKVVEQKMIGISSDEVGTAVWYGKIDDKELHLVKHYIEKFSFNYDGKIMKNGTVTEIKGKWDVNGYTGGFLLSHNDEEVD